MADNSRERRGDPEPARPGRRAGGGRTPIARQTGPTMPPSARSRRFTQVIGWRIAAIALFGVAIAANVAHRQISHAHKAGPAGLAEIGLGLAAFAATWIGVVLLLHGHRLFCRSLASTAPVAAEPVPPSFADRHAMAELLTAQVLARARAAHRAGGVPRDADRAE
jgi:hypothetical protein